MGSRRDERDGNGKPDGNDVAATDFSRVPYGVFTDHDVFELEQQRIFRGPTWTMIGLDAEVPEPGDFKTSYIGDTPVVISRPKTERSIASSTAAPTAAQL